jgi:hypothetical protein
MPNNYNTPSALMSISPSDNLNFTSRKNEFGWAANLGMSADLIGYMYLQEAARNEGYNLEREWGLVTLTASLELYYENMRASLNLFPSKSSSEKDSSSWGRISFTWYLE